jgi:hypothetical protein
MDKFIIEDHEIGIGKCLVLKSNWSSSYEAVIKENNISTIRLSFSNGWTDLDLSFLKNIHALKGIEIYSWKVNDLTPLYNLQNLIFIGIQADIKKKFELSKFSKLKILKIFWNDKVKQLYDCLNLEHINVVNFPYESFTAISNLSKLIRIQITSKKFSSTEGISKFRVLEDLDTHDCKKLNSFVELNKVKGLRKLQLSNCPNISDIDAVGELNNLELLIMENCGKIKNINCLRNCGNLKRLLLIGTTSVKDGDLSVIEKLPKLKDVRLSEQKHYNLTRGQIKKIIERK